MIHLFRVATDGPCFGEAEAFFCVKLVTDLQKHAQMLGREEVAKSIGPLAEQIFSDHNLQQMNMIQTRGFLAKYTSQHLLLCIVQVQVRQGSTSQLRYRHGGSSLEAPPRYHHTVQGAEELHRPVALECEAQAPISGEGGNC